MASSARSYTSSDTLRIVVSALFDDQRHRATVAGQVLRGTEGVEGLALRISVVPVDSQNAACEGVVVRTGALGAFGVHLDGRACFVGATVRVESEVASVTCCVQ